MEIFIQLLDELDDLLSATAVIWNRLSRAALSSGLLIALTSSAVCGMKGIETLRD